MQTHVGVCNVTSIYTIKNHYDGLLDNDTLVSEVDPTMMKLSEVGSLNGHDQMNMILRIFHQEMYLFQMRDTSK